MRNIIIGIVALLALIIGVSVIGSFDSDSKNLTRERAGELIKETYKRDLRHTTVGNGLTTSANSIQYRKYEAKTKEPALRALESEGYFSILGIGETYGLIKQSDIVTLELTDKSSPYLSDDKGWLYLADIDAVEVAGMSETSDTLKQVGCIVKFSPTPFGEALLPVDVDLERKARATLQLFDDGWRVMDLERSR